MCIKNNATIATFTAMVAFCNTLFFHFAHYRIGLSDLRTEATEEVLLVNLYFLKVLMPPISYIGHHFNTAVAKNTTPIAKNKNDKVEPTNTA